MGRRLFGVLGVAACSLLVAVPLLAANPAKSNSSEKAMQAWPAETLAGTIMTVDPSQNLVIVKGPDGVPFDMVVSRATRIESGSQHLTLDQLKADTNRNVSVRFVPERSGDVARSIQVTG